ncbi:MAG: hypothetical protein JWP94_3585 [Mucilaginibacter sp.]|jgi:transglutaminase-like putative cysteine protease|nr:hypothetical protein [Mucilaginibacter sp.]
MRSILISCLLLALSGVAKAQEIYNADLIPKDLLPYASAVIRNKEVSIAVKDLYNTTYYIKEAITVLNKNGDDMARIVIEHDKSNIIRNIKGAAYNEFGKQIKKFSEGDFDDVSAGNDFSLFEDTRLKHFLPAITEYPYTIAYEYETRSRQTLNFKEWYPNPGVGVAVEKSSFTFSCKPDFKIRYNENNIPGSVEINTNPAGLKTYTWRLNNLKAIKDEPLSPYYEKYLSCVKIAPENFTYYGISGAFTNWKELGKWEYDKLIAGRQELSPETIERVKEITKDITDPKLKAKKIYEYMQAKTHYISVQVGIGGNQPFLASDVDKQNYGDCKALVNYTQALLKAANIESYYCVVEANDDYKVSLLHDFASLEQGNHIILCLPFKNDTTWADCTSQTMPFGYLGGFTDDRAVLACTPEGGKLMHTPKYSVNDNIKSRKANFLIEENGNLKGNMVTTFRGADYDYRDQLINEPLAEKYKMLQKIYPINNLDIDNLDLKQDKGREPVTIENIKLHARDYATAANGKYYFMLNPVNRQTTPLRRIRNRLNDVYINRGFTDEDEVIYKLPEGLRLEKEPLNVSIEKPFGKFTATMQLKGNQLVYRRKFQLIDGTYNKDVYQDLVDFYQTVVDADEYTVSLMK